MNAKNLLLSGFQDFLPERMLPRDALVSMTRACFEKFGFLIQDTPCLERSELLLGKYGDNEKLVYSFRDHGNRAVSLRYDLTVPLSRIIKAYANEIVFPYRRYQVGMVWRADRPGKGRFREFMQIDADIVDDDSVLADIEILILVNYLMETLGVKVDIRFNCREILDALVETCQLDADNGVILMRIIDKFDKIGKTGVLIELADAEFSDEVVAKVSNYLEINGTNDQILLGLTNLLGKASTFQDGLTRLSTIINLIRQSDSELTNFKIDPTIARGLDYYTGLIFETKLIENPDFGSVCSGGRYDHLIQNSSNQFLPAIGLSIGIDRLFSAMESVNKAPAIKTTTKIFIANFGENFIVEYLRLASELRRANVTVEIFSKPSKIAKQINIANRKKIPLVLLVGSDEVSQSQVLLKDMQTGIQTAVKRDDVVAAVLKCLDEYSS